jgi:hypothetical protein
MAADPDLLTSPRCNGTDPCDDFLLTVQPPCSQLWPLRCRDSAAPAGRLGHGGLQP